MSQSGLKIQLQSLESLQELDLKILQIETTMSTVPESVQQLDKNLATLKIDLDKKSAAVNEVEKKRNQNQAAIDINNDRLDRAKKKVEGVANNQSFQAASKEIEQLKKLNETLTAENEKTAKELEELQKSHDEVKAKYDELDKKKTEEVTEFETKNSTLKTDLGELKGKRESILPGVTKPVLMKYDRIRKARAGLGLVPVVAGQCRGCNMMLPPQMYNELHRCEELAQCPTCHRILFLPEVKTATDGPGAEEAAVE